MRRYEPHTVPAADWMIADACELTALEEAGVQTCDVLIAATGDDKANLVVALLALVVGFAAAMARYGF